MGDVRFDAELDCRGLNCPMPLVKARQKIGDLGVGQVLRVAATDRGSVNDFKGWVKVAKNVSLLAQETVEEGGTAIYMHYVQRAS